jgi:hypothetical protein
MMVVHCALPGGGRMAMGRVHSKRLSAVKYVRLTNFKMHPKADAKGQFNND